MGDKNTTIDHVASKAEDAFWAEVVRRLPHIKSGDLDPGATVRFRSACREVIAAWVDQNTPQLVPPSEGGYYWIRNEEGVWGLAEYLVSADKWARFGFAHDDTAEFIGIVEWKGPIEPPAPPVSKREDGALTVGPPPDGKSVDESLERLQRVAKNLASVGQCPHCGKLMEVGDESEDERICDSCAAVDSANWGAFVKLLPEYNGWKATWEYPGFLMWSRKNIDLTVIATPDWDSGGKEEIVVDLQDHEGERVTFGGKSPDRVIEWPKSERSVDSYMKAVRPLLDEIDADRARYRLAAWRTLVDAKFDPDGEFMVEESDDIIVIPQEIPGAWVTVRLWVDERDLPGNCVNCTRPLDTEGQCRAGCNQEDK